MESKFDKLFKALIMECGEDGQKVLDECGDCNEAAESKNQKMVKPSLAKECGDCNEDIEEEDIETEDEEVTECGEVNECDEVTEDEEVTECDEADKGEKKAALTKEAVKKPANVDHRLIFKENAKKLAEKRMAKEAAAKKSK